MVITDETIVKIFPRGGWHYHTIDCWLAKSDDYIELPYSKVKTMKPDNSFKHYVPCGCIDGKNMDIRRLIK